MGGRLLKRKKRVKNPLILTDCPNCKKKFSKGDTGHFVPPSFGERGFFICEELRK